MRYLLDTNILYRWLRNDHRLGRKARARLAEADCAVSAASIWELLIKSVRHDLSLPRSSLSDAVVSQGFHVLAVTGQHVDASRRYDALVKDPFDRLLLATAVEEKMTLLTQDTGILELSGRYPIPVEEPDG